MDSNHDMNNDTDTSTLWAVPTCDPISKMVDSRHIKNSKIHDNSTKVSLILIKFDMVTKLDLPIGLTVKICGIWNFKMSDDC